MHTLPQMMEQRILQKIDDFTALNMMGIIRIFNKRASKHHDLLSKAGRGSELHVALAGWVVGASGTLFIFGDGRWVEKVSSHTPPQESLMVTRVRIEHMFVNVEQVRSGLRSTLLCPLARQRS